MMARMMGHATIAPRDLDAARRAGRVVIVDVNARESWSAARVPGAVHANPDTFTAADIPATDDIPLIFYCSNPLCRKAPRAASREKQFGRRDVRVMSAGINGWRACGLPTESGD